MHHTDEVNIKNFVVERALASIYPSIVNKSLHLASKECLSFDPNIIPVLLLSYILSNVIYFIDSDLETKET